MLCMLNIVTFLICFAVLVYYMITYNELILKPTEILEANV